MPNLKVGRFTDADTWSRIRRESLIQWLSPAREYFAQRGVDLPFVSSQDVIEYDKLAGIFANPDDAMPACLVESVFLISGMADENAMDALLAARSEQGLPVDFGEDHAPIDIAVQTYLDAPTLLRELHNQRQLKQPRSFERFVARTRSGVREMRTLELGFESFDTGAISERCTDADFAPPSAETLRALEAQLNAWFIKHKRGGHCRVFVYPSEDECLFLIRHGLPCKRESAIKDGESTSVFFRPQTHDVVGYSPEEGKLRIHCCGKRELDLFRRAFGRHLFDDDDFFPRVRVFDLAPLVNDGPASLRCSDVMGIQRVTLCELGFELDWKRECEVVYRAKNVFDLVAAGDIHLPPAQCIKRATFEIQFANSSSRRVTLLVPNRVLWGQDDNCPVIERWLKARGFEADLHEEEASAVAVA